MGSHNIELKTSKMFLKAAVLFLVILAQLMFAEAAAQGNWHPTGVQGGSGVPQGAPQSQYGTTKPPQIKSGDEKKKKPGYKQKGRRSAEPEPQWWPQARGYGSYGSYGGFSRGGFGSYGGYGGWQQQGRK